MSDLEFDPFSDVYFNDPYDVYRRLREEAPVYFSEKYGFYALSRFDDVVAAHKDWKAYSSSHGVDLASLKRPVDEVRGYGSLIMMDPPAHDRYRSLVNRVFTPRAISGLEPMVREVIAGLLDDLGDRNDFDAVAEWSALFPVEIICRMLGVPPEDRQGVRQRVAITLHREAGKFDRGPEAQKAMVEGAEYFFNLVAEKRKNPVDDMLSRLTQVTVDKGDGEETALTDLEIVGFASLIGGAGSETVTKLVGNAVVVFARYPKQWQKILDDPALIPSAVEEVLRFLPPSQYQGRFSHEERTFDGGTIPAGFPVLLITGAATRDPRAYDRPDDFEIERPQQVAIGFGHGIHSCLGAALARMESRIAFEELAKRWTTWEVDEGGLRRVHMSNVAGYENVPIHAIAA